MAGPRILIVAGLEPEGRAGLLADVAAVLACGGRAVACASAVTAQPEGGEVFIEPCSAAALGAQLDAAFADGPIAAVKLGMLARPELVEVVRDRLLRAPAVPLVIDPVLATSRGAALFAGGSRQAAYRELCRLRPVLTPNLPELGILSGAATAEDEPAEVRQAELLLAWGARAVLVKGGHRQGSSAHDLLLDADGHEERFEGSRLQTSARGKGCRLASAMAAFLAVGEPLPRAVERARAYVRVHLQSDEA